MDEPREEVLLEEVLNAPLLERLPAQHLADLFLGGNRARGVVRIDHQLRERGKVCVLQEEAFVLDGAPVDDAQVLRPLPEGRGRALPPSLPRPPQDFCRGSERRATYAEVPRHVLCSGRDALPPQHVTIEPNECVLRRDGHDVHQVDRIERDVARGHVALCGRCGRFIDLEPQAVRRHEHVIRPSSVDGPQGGDVPPQLALCLVQGSLIQRHLEFDDHIAKERVDPAPHHHGPRLDLHVPLHLGYQHSGAVRLYVSESLAYERQKGQSFARLGVCLLYLPDIGREPFPKDFKCIAGQQEPHASTPLR